LIKDRLTNTSQGFGFVFFDDVNFSNEILQMAYYGFMIDNKKVQVSYARYPMDEAVYWDEQSYYSCYSGLKPPIINGSASTAIDYSESFPNLPANPPKVEEAPKKTDEDELNDFLADVESDLVKTEEKLFVSVGVTKDFELIEKEKKEREQREREQKEREQKEREEWERRAQKAQREREQKEREKEQKEREQKERERKEREQKENEQRQKEAQNQPAPSKEMLANLQSQIQQLLQQRDSLLMSEKEKSPETFENRRMSISNNKTEPEDFLDEQQLICTLCQRRLKSSFFLQKHAEISRLHRDNLDAYYQLKRTVSLPQTQDEITAEGIRYRNRAAERREQFGQTQFPFPTRSSFAEGSENGPHPRSYNHFDEDYHTATKKLARERFERE